MSLSSVIERSRDALGILPLYVYSQSTPTTESYRSLLLWLFAFALLLLGAVVTNPGENSFRSHLTELSFRSAMADFRRSEDEANDDHNHSQLDKDKDKKGSQLPITGGDTATPHPISPLRFANRVAISLRTPTLYYRSFFVLSISITPPLQSPAYLSENRQSTKKNAAIKERHLLWLGTWGGWTEVMLIPLHFEWMWRLFTKERDKGRKRNVDKPGVFEIRQVTPEKEAVSTTPNAKASLSPATAKNLRKSDSVSNLESLPLHAPIPPSPESRRPSLVNVPPTSSPAPEMTSPVLTSLKAELSSAQTVVSDLTKQLNVHEVFVHEAHAHLQSTLDDLRTKRKEDDAERQELKAKTKTSEEQKRQAESARREAEKKLRAVESLRDGLESKIKAAQGAISETKAQMENSEKSVKLLREEGERHVVGTRQEVERKKQELKEVEAEIVTVEGNNEMLEFRLREAEERLKEVIKAGEAARSVAPEEEMMMMAAAYEVAAQEGHYTGYHQPPHSGGYPVNASQAAAVMAEGLPHLGYDYTAKPTSTVSGFGHLSKGNTSANSSHKDLHALRRYADMTGFEDFGPGAVNGTNSRRLSSQGQQSDTESDIYGHEPGSPNGLSSSFSANLLPQGLFSSLEGETPYVGHGSATMDDPRQVDLGEDQDDSGSSVASDSPRPAFVERPHLDHIKRLSGSASASRLPMPNTSPSLSPNGNIGHPSHTTTPPLLAGLPNLPGSRRWFSGTVSSDSLALPTKPKTKSTFAPFSGIGFHHATTSSNDSLHLAQPGYESPFAPTEGEKKALALAHGKWGGFSKKWAGSGSGVSAGAGTGAGTSVYGDGGWPSGLGGLGWGRREGPAEQGLMDGQLHGGQGSAFEGNANGNVNNSQGFGVEGEREDDDKAERRYKFPFLRRSQNQLP